MARISQEEIDRVRSQADIVDVIGHYLQITRKGRSFTAVCPFHDDHTPSMKIDQSFYCFGCQASGDVITLTARLFNLSNIDAAKKLIEDFNLQIQTNLTVNYQEFLLYRKNIKYIKR